MSFTILLQGKLLGIEPYLASPVAPGGDQRAFLGRIRWVTLLNEVIPRALLAELGLAKILLGSSGGGQFLAVLPVETRDRAEEFLATAAAHIDALSGHRVSLVWTATENLGDWNVIRKRLRDGIAATSNTPVGDEASIFIPGAVDADPLPFAGDLGGDLPAKVSWSPEQPAMIRLDTGGKYTWDVREDLRIAAHAAPPRPGLWGVLTGNVDQFEIRLQRAQLDVEYLQLAISYQSFFAEELQMLCSQPPFADKVSILHSGGSEFAVSGEWEALIDLGREVHRLFEHFVAANLKDLPGAEGKTIAMALAIANVPEQDTLPSVYGQATAGLRIAKSAHKGAIHLMGRTLEWKHLADAASLKDALVQLIAGHGVDASSIRELQGIYRETQTRETETGRGTRRQRIERPWRYMRRINRVLDAEGRRDFQKLRRRAAADLVGGNPSQMKLRPSGRVALEWARLSTESK